jgi:hypothetical protein
VSADGRNDRNALYGWRKCHLIEIGTERDFGTEKSVQFWRRLSRMGKGNLLGRHMPPGDLTASPHDCGNPEFNLVAIRVPRDAKGLKDEGNPPFPFMNL